MARPAVRGFDTALWGDARSLACVLIGVGGAFASAVSDSPAVDVASVVAMAIAALTGITTGSRAVGPTLARIRSRLLDPFSAFALVVVATSVQVVVAGVLDRHNPVAAAGLQALAALFLSMGLLGLLAERYRGHGSQLGREAGFVATFVGVTTWVMWLETPWKAGDIGTAAALLALLGTAIAFAGLLLSFRLASGVSGATRSLVAPAAVLTLSGVLGLVGQLQQTRWTEEAVVATALATGGLLGAALCHPRLGPLRTTVVVPPTRAGAARLAIVLLSVLLVPTVTLGRLLSDAEINIPSLALATAILSVAAVAYLGGLARDWSHLERRARHDELTGLNNRRSFTERLAIAVTEAASSGEQPAILFCDLDRFKVVNDSLGHAAGNQLLMAVANRLTEALPPDSMAARLGGDEFAILLPHAKENDAVVVAKSVLGQLQNPIDVHGRTVHVNASIGVARYPHDGIEPDTLLRAADTAMYRAKDLGRARVVVHSETLRNEAEGRFALESDLHRAIDEGQLRLVYQPRVDLVSGDVIGAEALLRWNHPKLGPVSPARFIPVAEETGLIRRIGVHALREACRQLAAWERAGYPKLTISVNLSARQFELDRVADIVARILRETDADPTWLELELTESLAHDDIDDVSTTLADLAAMGVRCSIDDFGTGYSGLSYLGRFPLHALKIDKGFVQAIDQPKPPGTMGDPATVVAAVVALGRAFGLRVIAEGVETTGQLRFLLKTGCDELQGHLFSPPLEVEAFESLIMLERIAAGPGRLATLRAEMDREDAVARRTGTGGDVIHLGGRRLGAR